MSKRHLDGNLPHDPRSFDQDCKHYGSGSIHDLETTDSASEISVPQFLSLKILWTPRRSIRELYEDSMACLYDSSKNEVKEMRATMAREDTAWVAYIGAIEGKGTSGARFQQKSKFSRDLGIYALVLQNQLEVSAMKESLDDSAKLRVTPMKEYNLRSQHIDGNQDPKGKGKAPRSQSRGSSHPSQTSKISSGPSDISPERYQTGFDKSIGDEQIVNTAAINFLNALFIYEERAADWTLQRKQFKFASNSVKFEARSDGHLQVHGQRRSAAILEVKPRRRFYETGFRIEMQESAQMALWIHQEPNSHWAPSVGKGEKYYRVLLSQDNHEIYVTIAEYTRRYIDYLQGNVPFEEADFLTMNLFGPFSTKRSDNMSWLGAILRVLLPYAADCRPGRLPSPQPPRTPSRSRTQPSEEAAGNAPVREDRRRPESSPLRRSISSSSGSKPPIERLGKLELSEKVRSSSKAPPKKGSASSGEEAAPPRSAASSPSTGPSSQRPPASSGEQSRLKKGQKDKERGREKTRK